MPKKTVYTNLTRGQKQWLEQKAEGNDLTKSEVLRMLVHEARVREQMGEPFLTD